jgi:hydroxyacyl-ACP dehydratase HTD2-like protein with hotdog domain
MGTSKDILIDEVYDLKEKIKELKEQLSQAKQHTYIHETHHLYCQDGEMYFGFGDVEEEKGLVYNTDQLFKDLPFIINQVVKENNKMQDMYLDKIKDELKEL